MKKIFIILLLTTSLTRAQEYVEQIKQLESSKKQISDRIILLNDSIRKIDLKINVIKSKEFQKIISESSLVVFAKKNAYIKKTPDVLGEIILTLEEDKKVVVLDYHDEFFGVCVDSICGYMNEMWIIGNEKTSEFVKIKRQEELELERLKDEHRIKENERKSKEEDVEYAKIEKANLKKYGKEVYEELKKGYYWIGMTNEMALISLGSPNDNNRSVGSWGVHEQWVYNNGLYLYFENGKLKSYQN